MSRPALADEGQEKAGADISFARRKDAGADRVRHVRYWPKADM